MSAGKKECGCWWESCNGMAFSFEAAKPMPPQSAFTDNALGLMHYCDTHWAEREARAPAVIAPPQPKP